MVHIWNCELKYLQRQRFLGLYKELHIAYYALTWNPIKGKYGYTHHPEVLRFKDHVGQLVDLHNKMVLEARRRGYKLKTALRFFPHKPERYVFTNGDLAEIQRRQQESEENREA